MNVAYASLAELETHIQIGLLLGYLEESETLELMNQAEEIGRMLNGLQRSLRTQNKPE